MCLNFALNWVWIDDFMLGFHCLFFCFSRKPFEEGVGSSVGSDGKSGNDRVLEVNIDF